MSAATRTSSSSYVVVPKDQDVILGKGRRIQNHVGNIKLRQLGVEYRERYAGQPNSIKTQIRQDIVDLVRKEGGRFLELDNSTQLYRDVGDKRAREKVRHVLSDQGGKSTCRRVKLQPTRNQRENLPTSIQSKENAMHIIPQPVEYVNSDRKRPPTSISIPTCQFIESDYSEKPPTAESSAERVLSSTSSMEESSVEEQQKIRQRQQRLLLLRHGATCQHSSTTKKCPVTDQCAKVKQLWNHVESCTDEQCTFKHCLSSKYILAHYHSCSDQSCPECGPLRATLWAKRNSNEPSAKRQRIGDDKVVAV